MSKYIVEIISLGTLALIICVGLAMLVWSGTRDSMDVRGYRPYRNGERVTCIYDEKALYCSEP